MLPKTLSASSLKVAALCMLRWREEYFKKGEGFSGVAANIGTAVHGGLEKYVDLVYIQKTHQPDLTLLLSLYEIAYIETFGHADKSTPEFVDGQEMTVRWFKRTSFEGVEVLSVEKKLHLQVPVTVDGKKTEMPFTYIIDRLDRLGPGEYRVVDYKTVRVPIQPDDLDNLIQARVYALAVQKQYPDATKIRVVFDLIRHDQVGLVFKKEENVATAYYLMEESQRIVDTDENSVVPTLNMECGYCLIKSTCPAMKSNIDAGGLHSLTLDQLMERKLLAESQNKANKILLDELEDLLLKEAVEQDSLQLESPSGAFEMQVTAQRRRAVDASAVAKIIGPELFADLGSITLGKLDELIKDTSIPEETRNALKNLIYYTTGEPKAKVGRKKALL